MEGESVVSTSTDAPTTSIKFIFILFGIFLSLGLSLEESTPRCLSLGLSLEESTPM